MACMWLATLLLMFQINFHVYTKKLILYTKNKNILPKLCTLIIMSSDFIPPSIN